ncbi:MAG: hypothetical protein ABSF43_18055 [Rectinemataceae bacterium]|jgi:hypothetical protein
MRPTATCRILPIALASGFLLSALPLCAGPILAPGQKLFVIKTEHFDIIFPKKSEPTALRLSRIAEEVYAESSAKLDAKLPARVPVVITPDIGVFNGFTSAIPYMHIVLYDTPLDIGWTAFKDNFRGLFLHELTHAVSLQIKAPWASFLSGIFGSWVAPALLNAPEFMIEGVAVSIESGDDGIEGRANDPLVKERLRQDILENRFKTPLEAEGVYDEYPGGSIYYEYGGLFNAYIQKAYGMEAYVKLWKAMGDLIFSISLDLYEQGFFKAFERIYGIPFLKAWADFRLSLSITGAVDPPEILVPSAPSSIGGLASGGGGLFWVDARSSRAYRLDAATGKATVLFDAGAADLVTDVSANGGRLLVARTIALSDGRDRVETAVYDTTARRFIAGSETPDLRDARFFRGGLVGILPNLHNSDLIYTEKGENRILLPGSEGVMYSSPAVLDEARVALIVSIEGRRTIGILDVDSGLLRLLRPRGPENEGLLDYVRQISASSGRIYFNYDSDDRMYKLGVLDLDAGDPTISLDTTDYSGGILMPRELGGRVYYVGRFSGGDGICRYPGSPILGGRILGGRILGGRILGVGFEAFDPKAIHAEEEAETPRSAAETSILPYRPLAYANPFNAWALYPDLNTIDRSTRVFGLFYFQDPIESNSVLLNAGYDFAWPFADSSVTWTNTSLPLRLDLSAGDNLVYGASGPPERQSSGQALVSLGLPVFPSPRQAILGLGATVFARAQGTEGSPYAWPIREPSMAVSANVGWLGRIPGTVIDSSRGIDLVSYQDFDLKSQVYKTEAQLVLATDTVPLRIDLWGAWASECILSLDAASPVFTADRRPAYVEYQDLRTGSSELLAEGDASWRIADQAIHSSLLDLYFNRLLIDWGFRGAYFQAEFLTSCYARVSLDVAAGIGALGGIGVRAFTEVYACLSETNPSQMFGLRLGIQTSAGSGASPLRGESRGLE